MCVTSSRRRKLDRYKKGHGRFMRAQRCRCAAVLTTMWTLTVLLVAIGAAGGQSREGAFYPPPGAPSSGSDASLSRAPANGPAANREAYNGRSGDRDFYASSSSSSSGGGSAGSSLSSSSLSPEMTYAIWHLSESIRLHALAEALPYYPDHQPPVPVLPNPAGPGWTWPLGPQYSGSDGTGSPGDAGTYPYGGYNPGNGGYSGAYNTGNAGTYPSGAYNPGNGGYSGAYNPGNAGTYPSGAYPPGNAGTYSSGGFYPGGGLRSGPRSGRDSATNADNGAASVEDKETGTDEAPLLKSSESRGAPAAR